MKNSCLILIFPAIRLEANGIVVSEDLRIPLREAQARISAVSTSEQLGGLLKRQDTLTAGTDAALPGFSDPL